MSIVRRVSMVALASICALVLGASQLGAASPKPIVVGALKGPSGIGLVRLFESPPLPADGGAIQMVAVPSADLMTAKLISGEYDAGVLPVNVAAKLYNSGIGLRLCAVIGEGMVSLLGTDDSIKSLTDLRGKSVNVSGQGATPDYLLRRLLKGAGLDPEKDLKLEYALAYPEAAVALASGKIAYAVLPEPFATMAKMQNPKLKAVLDLGALWTAQTGQKSYPMTALVVSSRLAAERPQAVKTLLDAASASIAWAVANPAEAGSLVEKNELGLKAPIAAKAIPRSAYVFIPAPAARGEIEAMLGVFLDLAPASVGGKLPDGGFYASFD
jgi:NitT/TauT family transport system substrate-binding protein